MGTTQSSEAIIPHAHILPFSYQIDLRKLRFYHAKHITTSVGGTDGIVWHALIATSKRMVDTIMVEYGIFTARCTLVQSAVLRSHVVCLSVCPSVCLSVCNVGEL